MRSDLSARSRITCGALLAICKLGGCGVVDENIAMDVDESAIYGGSSDANYNYPWVVYVCAGQNGLGCITDGNKCHGVLIHSRWVLTSGTCDPGGALGMTVAYSRTTAGGVATQDFQHIGGTAGALQDDLLLLPLATAFSDPLVQPAELPLYSMAVGQAGLVASGRPTPSQIGISTPTVDAVGLAGQPDKFTAAASTSSLCSSDRGSGFITQTGGRNYVTGIVSATPGSCNATNVTWTGTSVLSHLPFIFGTIGSTSGLMTANFTPTAQLYSSGLDFGLPSTWETITGDFNGDGRSDYARVGSSITWLYFGSSSGTFTEGWLDYSDLSFGQPSSWTTIVGNFERTGNATCSTCMDFVRLGATGMWMFYGNSNGTFTRAFQSYPGLDFQQPSPWQTAVGDFDADGRTDYARLGDTGAWVYYGNTNRTFTQTFYAYQPGYDFFLPSPYSLAVGDFNGDGRADYARLGGTAAYIYYGAAGRTFTPGAQSYAGLDFGAPSTWETINGNFNGDSRADYARIGATGAWVYYGAANGFTQAFHSYGGDNFGQPSNFTTIVGDFSGDGKTDYGRLGDTAGYFYYGSATLGTFATLFQEYQRHFGQPSSFSSASSDFNGDLKADYVRLGGVFEHTFIRN